MMYLKIKNENGTMTFAPLKSDNIYILCKDCGSMVQVNNAEEFDYGEVPFEDIDLCAECSARRDAIEEEYLAQEQSRKIVEVVKAVKKHNRIAAEDGKTLSEDELRDFISTTSRKITRNSLLENDGVE